MSDDNKVPLPDLGASAGVMPPLDPSSLVADDESTTRHAGR